MRVLKFAKIDILLCKSYMWILLFPVLVLAIVILEPDMNSLYGTIYCLFGGLVLSSLPFTLHDPRQTGGFTRLLPARQGDDIKGHFLFSFLFLLLFLILSLPAAGLGGLFKGETAALLSHGLFDLPKGRFVKMTGIHLARAVNKIVRFVHEENVFLVFSALRKKAL